MKLTWKWTAANALLLVTIGCTGGEEASAPSPGGEGGSVPKVAPVTPTPAKSDSAKSEASPSAKVPEAAKIEPKSEPSKKSDDGPAVEGPKAENSKSATSGALSQTELAAIKELPESEQATAIKQAVCPASGEPLGGMGKPLKVTYVGRTFYLCCKSCEAEVKADPKAIIAKLDKK